jgi:RNA polymerase sigma-70 factor (ECF subfamily)
MNSSEDALIERLHQRDQEALASFLEANKPRLLAYIERSLGAALRRKIEPVDVAQEVYVQALRGLPDADFQQRDPLSWLCHLAEQRIIDAHRKLFGAKKRSASRETRLEYGSDRTGEQGMAHLLAASMTSPSRAFSRNEKEFRLLAALETLPEESREALRLRYAEGLATKDIAKRLSKTDGAIRVLLTRSVKRLQELLGAESY